MLGGAAAVTGGLTTAAARAASEEGEGCWAAELRVRVRVRGTLTVQAERGADLTLKDEGPGIRTRYSSSGGKALVYCNIFFSASGGAALFYNKRRKKRGKKL